MSTSSIDNRLPINRLLETFHKVKKSQRALPYTVPKLENFKISVTRSFLKGIDQAARMANPTKGLHRCIYPKLEWSIAWYNFQFFVVSNRQEIQTIISSIPVSRGQPTKALKKMLKNDLIQWAFALYIEVLSSWNDTGVYSHIFRIHCCDGMHDACCFSKWYLIFNFLQARMESKKWLK